MTMIIYMITNTVNGKYYIGKTVGTIKSRWKGHKHSAKNRPSGPLHFAMRKYGIENFSTKILSIHGTIEELDIAEIKAIEQYKSRDRRFGYNRTLGGDGAPMGNNYMKGHRHSPEARLKMSNSHTGLKLGPQSQRHRRLISHSLKGIVRGSMPEWHRLKISEAIKNKNRALERR